MNAMNTTRDLISESLDRVKQRAKAMASTASLAKPYLPQKLTEMNAGSLVAGLGHVKNQAAAMVSTRDGAVGAAALVIGGAVGAYFLWPVAAGATAAAGATMKAPGAAGFIISRAAFLANTQLYFKILHTAGAAAAAAAFAL